MAKPKAVLPASSGYRLYSALKNPLFAQRLITRYYPKTISGNITTSDVIDNRIKNQGDTVIFRRAPVAELFEYQKNQDLEVSQLNTEPDQMVIDRAFYFNVKLDRVDQKQIPDVNDWIKAFIDDALEKQAQRIDSILFRELPWQVDCQNKGAHAGAVDGSADLGTAGSPVALTKNNILEFIQQMAVVLDQANVPTQGRYLVLPTSARLLLAGNEVLADAGASGLNRSAQLMAGSQWPTEIGGFRLYFSNVMPRYYDDAASKHTHIILAGIKNATGLVTQLSEQDVIDQDPRSFSKYWRGLNVWGFKALRPEAMAAAYVNLDYSLNS